MKTTTAIKAFPLALCLTSPMAQAQQYGPGVDPYVVMMLDQIVSYVWQRCQMGDGAACQNVQQVQIEAQNLIGAGQYCFQTNDPNACNYYMNVVGQMQQSQMQMGGQMSDYDPSNPMGATHQERMDYIAGVGAQNTQNWLDRGAASDASQSAFLEYINQ